MTEFFTILFLGGFVAACCVFATFVLLTIGFYVVVGILALIFGTAKKS